MNDALLIGLRTAGTEDRDEVDRLMHEAANVIDSQDAVIVKALHALEDPPDVVAALAVLAGSWKAADA